MSRTRHPRRGDDGEVVSQRRQRARAPVQLTPHKSGSWYVAWPIPVRADGNQWGGTISHVGGDQRRRDQRDRRAWKIIGRRRDRRRRNRGLGIY